jgi:hypothetical protein
MSQTLSYQMWKLRANQTVKKFVNEEMIIVCESQSCNMSNMLIFVILWAEWKRTKETMKGPNKYDLERPRSDLLNYNDTVSARNALGTHTSMIFTGTVNMTIQIQFSHS